MHDLDRNGMIASMKEIIRPTLQHCIICQLPQKRLTEVNVALIVDGKNPIEVAVELGVSAKALKAHVEHCLDMPVHAGRVVQMTKQRLEIDPEEVVRRLMANLDAVEVNAEKLEGQNEHDKAGRLRLGLAAQLAKFIETVMERAERVQLTQQLEEALQAAAAPGGSPAAQRPRRSASEALRALSAEELREQPPTARTG